MGMCQSGPERTASYKVEKKLNNEIATKLDKDWNEDTKFVKILILGSGESGKSTILKQLKILHCGGFTETQRIDYRDLLRENCLQCMDALCIACKEFRLCYSNQSSIKLSQKLHKLYLSYLDTKTDDSKELTEIGNVVNELWKDDGIKTALSRRNEFQLLESAEFLLNHVIEIFSPSYIPNNQHILRSRRPTLGITETSFEIENVPFRVYDVGGQRGERRKWIHCFEGVRAIMFVASLSEYDQVLEEDHTRNRTKESLNLFKGITMLPWFRTTNIMLFLNKQDVFEEKIKTSPLDVYFPSYTGGNDYAKAVEYIASLYHSQASTLQNIYTHVTCALDTKKTEFVWKAARHIILEENLLVAGLMG